MNVEFIEVVDERTLKVRVWERGSGETMACGTGACAAVVAATLNGRCTKGEDIRVILKGGDLTVRYTDARVLMRAARRRSSTASGSLIQDIIISAFRFGGTPKDIL